MQMDYSTGNSKRLLSLDALRGFDMLLIIGTTMAIEFLLNGLGMDKSHWLAIQFKHAAWNGLTFQDFIFPLFLYMVGVSIVFSISAQQRKGKPNSDIYKKAFKRMIILSLLGIVYKNYPLHFDFENIRFVSVLGRIGITGFFVTIIVLKCSIRSQIAWMFGLLIAYWAAMMFIPVPGYGAGNLTLEGNLAGFIDRIIVPGRLANGVFDENGYFEHIPATALVLMGALTSHILRYEKFVEMTKVRYITLSGVGLILLGILWSLHFPINKHLWSSSFILVTGGSCMLSMALFYWVIDVLKFQKWTFFFVVIGLNSITVYLTEKLIDWQYTVDYLLNGFYGWLSEPMAAFLMKSGIIALNWLLMYILYKKKIFLKV